VPEEDFEELPPNLVSFFVSALALSLTGVM